jgi:hypothetical protein
VAHWGVSDRAVTKLNSLPIDTIDRKTEEIRTNGHDRQSLNTPSDLPAGTVAGVLGTAPHDYVDTRATRHYQHDSSGAERNLPDLIEREAPRGEWRDPAREHCFSELIDSLRLLCIKRPVRSRPRLPKQCEALDQSRVNPVLLVAVIHATSLRQPPA